MTDIHRAVAAVMGAAQSNEALFDLIAIVVGQAEDLASAEFRVRLDAWAERQGTTLAEIEASAAAIPEEEAKEREHNFASALAVFMMDGRGAELMAQQEAAQSYITHAHDAPAPNDADMIESLMLIEELGLDTPAFIGMLLRSKAMAQVKPDAWAAALEEWRAVYAGDRARANIPSAGDQSSPDPRLDDLAASQKATAFSQLSFVIGTLLQASGNLMSKAERELLWNTMTALGKSSRQGMN